MSSYLDRIDNANKYNIQSLTFPEDLFGDQSRYGDSWMMININTLTTSRYSSRYKTVDISQRDRRDFTNTQNSNIRGDTPAQRAANAGISVGAAVAIPGIVKGIGDYLNGGGPRAAVNAVSTGVKGVAAGGFAALPLANGVKETKRIDSAIMLPMPQELTTPYSMEWGEDSVALLNAALRMGGASVDAVKAAFTGDTTTLKNIGGGALDAATALSLGTQSALGSSGISALTGVAYNQKQEQIFRGVGFRTFTMDYIFYPKSVIESARLLAILSTLKFHMHPEYQSEGRYTFVYPSEFDITFYHQGEENLWINKIATCVLTNLTINNTPFGLWAQHEAGAPVAQRVSMTFKELSILTKETVEQGF